MLKLIVCISGVCLLLSGCHRTSRRTIAEAIPPIVTESNQIDATTGNLIAWWMVRTEGTPTGELVPVLIEHPYAIFIQWPNEEYYPESADQRVFVFYDNVSKKTYQTHNFDAFLRILADQPRNISLLQLDTCTVSRDYMPAELRNQMQEILAAGNRTWATNPVEGAPTFRVCYCEFDWHFVFPCDKH